MPPLSFNKSRFTLYLHLQVPAYSPHALSWQYSAVESRHTCYCSSNQPRDLAEAARIPRDRALLHSAAVC